MTYRNLAEKEESELEMLLLAALQNQVRELKEQQDCDETLVQRLEARIEAIINKDEGGAVGEVMEEMGEMEEDLRM